MGYRDYPGAREDERARIGRELHDGVCQDLAGAMYGLEVLRQKMAARGAPEVSAVVATAELVDRALREARALARATQPTVPGDGGLAPALTRLAAEVEGVFGVSCVLVNDGAAGAIRGARAAHLYRIAREAVGNAVRHGRARGVTIGLATVGGRVRMTIADDGVGLGNAPDDGAGMGLGTMAHRARVIGGALDVRAGDRGGAVVVCTAPVRRCAGRSSCGR